MLENKESNRDTSREAEVKWGTRETIDSSNIWLHKQVAVAAEKNIILVVYDRLVKITYFMTTTERTSVERLV